MGTKRVCVNGAVAGPARKIGRPRIADRASLLTGRVVGARLTEAETEAFDAFCARRALTASQAVRALVREALGLKENAEPTVAIRVFDPARSAPRGGGRR